MTVEFFDLSRINELFALLVHVRQRLLAWSRDLRTGFGSAIMIRGCVCVCRSELYEVSTGKHVQILKKM
jgi:hypothetical protein